MRVDGGGVISVINLMTAEAGRIMRAGINWRRKKEQCARKVKVRQRDKRELKVGVIFEKDD